MRRPSTPSTGKCRESWSGSATSRKTGSPCRSPNGTAIAANSAPESPRSGSVARALGELDLDVHLFAAAEQSDGDFVPGAPFVQDQIHVQGRRDLLFVDGGQHIPADVKAPHAGLRDTIAAADAGLGRGAAPRGGLHEQSLLSRKPERFGKRLVDRNRFHSEEGLVHPAIGDQVVRDSFGGVDGDGEPDARGGSGGR